MAIHFVHPSFDESTTSVSGEARAFDSVDHISHLAELIYHFESEIDVRYQDCIELPPCLFFYDRSFSPVEVTAVPVDDGTSLRVGLLNSSVRTVSLRIHDRGDISNDESITFGDVLLKIRCIRSASSKILLQSIRYILRLLDRMCIYGCPDLLVPCEEKFPPDRVLAIGRILGRLIDGRSNSAWRIRNYENVDHFCDCRCAS